jgi:hypothetical protein
MSSKLEDDSIKTDGSSTKRSTAHTFTGMIQH